MSDGWRFVSILAGLLLMGNTGGAFLHAIVCAHEGCWSAVRHRVIIGLVTAGLGFWLFQVGARG